MSDDVTVQRPTLRVRWRSLSRARKAALVSPAVFLAVVGSAAAALMFLAPITGSTHVSGAAITFTGQPTATPSDGATCNAAIQSGGQLNLSFTGVPGDTCTVITYAKEVGDLSGLKVQGVTYSDKITAALVGSCGKELTTALNTPVMIKFTIPTDTAMGDYPADASAGLKVVRTADYSAGACPGT